MSTIQFSYEGLLRKASTSRFLIVLARASDCTLPAFCLYPIQTPFYLHLHLRSVDMIFSCGYVFIHSYNDSINTNLCILIRSASCKLELVHLQSSLEYKSEDNRGSDSLGEHLIWTIPSKEPLGLAWKWCSAFHALSKLIHCSSRIANIVVSSNLNWKK